ncbi:MAG: hypothetical protein JNL76_06395 [Alphaproteobacteria bacterium]|nr:hypothetical protein [Alphaproteobacteria bacterium]
MLKELLPFAFAAATAYPAMAAEITLVDNTGKEPVIHHGNGITETRSPIVDMMTRKNGIIYVAVGLDGRKFQRTTALGMVFVESGWIVMTTKAEGFPILKETRVPCALTAEGQEIQTLLNSLSYYYGPPYTTEQGLAAAHMNMAAQILLKQGRILCHLEPKP